MFSTVLQMKKWKCFKIRMISLLKEKYILASRLYKSTSRAVAAEEEKEGMDH